MSSRIQREERDYRSGFTINYKLLFDANPCTGKLAWWLLCVSRCLDPLLLAFEKARQLFSPQDTPDPLLLTPPLVACGSSKQMNEPS